MAVQSGDTSSGSSEVSLVVRMPVKESELRSLRDGVRSFLQERCADDEVVDDVELAVSELATNVIQHSTADSVSVVVRRVATGWQLDVHDADEVPALDDVKKPPSDSITGRGLFTVQSVMDEMSIEKLGDNTIIRCTRYDT